MTIAGDEKLAFVEVTVAAPAESPTDDPLKLLLGGNFRLIIRRALDAQTLREVVRALDGLT